MVAHVLDRAGLLCIKNVLKGKSSSKIPVSYVDPFIAVNISLKNTTTEYCYKHRSAQSKPFVSVAPHLNIDWGTFIPKATPRMPSCSIWFHQYIFYYYILNVHNRQLQFSAWLDAILQPPNVASCAFYL